MSYPYTFSHENLLSRTVTRSSSTSSTAAIHKYRREPEEKAPEVNKRTFGNGTRAMKGQGRRSSRDVAASYDGHDHSSPSRSPPRAIVSFVHEAEEDTDKHSRVLCSTTPKNGLVDFSNRLGHRGHVDPHQQSNTGGLGDSNGLTVLPPALFLSSAPAKGNSDAGGRTSGTLVNESRKVSGEFELPPPPPPRPSFSLSIASKRNKKELTSNHHTNGRHPDGIGSLIHREDFLLSALTSSPQHEQHTNTPAYNNNNSSSRRRRELPEAHTLVQEAMPLAVQHTSTSTRTGEIGLSGIRQRGAGETTNLRSGTSYSPSFPTIKKPFRIPPPPRADSADRGLEHVHNNSKSASGPNSSAPLLTMYAASRSRGLEDAQNRPEAAIATATLSRRASNASRSSSGVSSLSSPSAKSSSSSDSPTSPAFANRRKEMHLRGTRDRDRDTDGPQPTTKARREERTANAALVSPDKGEVRNDWERGEEEYNTQALEGGGSRHTPRRFRSGSSTSSNALYPAHLSPLSALLGSSGGQQSKANKSGYVVSEFDINYQNNAASEQKQQQAKRSFFLRAIAVDEKAKKEKLINPNTPAAQFLFDADSYKENLMGSFLSKPFLSPPSLDGARPELTTTSEGTVGNREAKMSSAKRAKDLMEAILTKYRRDKEEEKKEGKAYYAAKDRSRHGGRSSGDGALLAAPADGTYAADKFDSSLRHQAVLGFIDMCKSYDVPEDVITAHAQVLADTMATACNAYAELHRREADERVLDFELRLKQQQQQQRPLQQAPTNEGSTLQVRQSAEITKTTTTKTAPTRRGETAFESDHLRQDKNGEEGAEKDITNAATTHNTRRNRNGERMADEEGLRGITNKHSTNVGQLNVGSNNSWNSADLRAAEREVEVPLLRAAVSPVSLRYYGESTPQKAQLKSLSEKDKREEIEEEEENIKNTPRQQRRNPRETDSERRRERQTSGEEKQTWREAEGPYMPSHEDTGNGPTTIMSINKNSNKSHILAADRVVFVESPPTQTEGEESHLNKQNDKGNKWFHHQSHAPSQKRISRSPPRSLSPQPTKRSVSPQPKTTKSSSLLMLTTRQKQQEAKIAQLEKLVLQTTTKATSTAASVAVVNGGGGGGLNRTSMSTRPIGSQFSSDGFVSSSHPATATPSGNTQTSTGNTQTSTNDAQEHEHAKKKTASAATSTATPTTTKKRPLTQDRIASLIRIGVLAAPQAQTQHKQEQEQEQHRRQRSQTHHALNPSKNTNKSLRSSSSTVPGTRVVVNANTNRNVVTAAHQQQQQQHEKKARGNSSKPQQSRGGGALSTFEIEEKRRLRGEQDSFFLRSNIHMDEKSNDWHASTRPQPRTPQPRRFSIPTSDTKGVMHVLGERRGGETQLITDSTMNTNSIDNLLKASSAASEEFSSFVEAGQLTGSAVYVAPTSNVWKGLGGSRKGGGLEKAKEGNKKEKELANIRLNEDENGPAVGGASPIRRVPRHGDESFVATENSEDDDNNNSSNKKVMHKEEEDPAVVCKIISLDGANKGQGDPFSASSDAFVIPSLGSTTSHNVLLAAAREEKAHQGPAFPRPRLPLGNGSANKDNTAPLASALLMNNDNKNEKKLIGANISSYMALSTNLNEVETVNGRGGDNNGNRAPSSSLGPITEVERAAIEGVVKAAVLEEKAVEMSAKAWREHARAVLDEGYDTDESKTKKNKEKAIVSVPPIGQGNHRHHGNSVRTSTNTSRVDNDVTINGNENREPLSLPPPPPPHQRERSPPPPLPSMDTEDTTMTTSVLPRHESAENRYHRHTNRFNDDDDDEEKDEEEDDGPGNSVKLEIVSRQPSPSVAATSTEITNVTVTDLAIASSTTTNKYYTTTIVVEGVIAPRKISLDDDNKLNICADLSNLLIPPSSSRRSPSAPPSSVAVGSYQHFFNAQHQHQQQQNPHQLFSTSSSKSQVDRQQSALLLQRGADIAVVLDSTPATTTGSSSPHGAPPPPPSTAPPPNTLALKAAEEEASTTDTTLADDNPRYHDRSSRMHVSKKENTHDDDDDDETRQTVAYDYSSSSSSPPPPPPPPANTPPRRSIVIDEDRKTWDLDELVSPLVPPRMPSLVRSGRSGDNNNDNDNVNKDSDDEGKSEEKEVQRSVGYVFVDSHGHVNDSKDFVEKKEEEEEEEDEVHSRYRRALEHYHTPPPPPPPRLTVREKDNANNNAKYTYNNTTTTTNSKDKQMAQQRGRYQIGGHHGTPPSRQNTMHGDGKEEEENEILIVARSPNGSPIRVTSLYPSSPLSRAIRTTKEVFNGGENAGKEHKHITTSDAKTRIHNYDTNADRKQSLYIFANQQRRHQHQYMTPPDYRSREETVGVRDEEDFSPPPPLASIPHTALHQQQRLSPSVTKTEDDHVPHPKVFRHTTTGERGTDDGGNIPMGSQQTNDSPALYYNQKEEEAADVEEERDFVSLSPLTTTTVRTNTTTTRAPHSQSKDHSADHAAKGSIPSVSTGNANTEETIEDGIDDPTATGTYEVVSSVSTSSLSSDGLGSSPTSWSTPSSPPLPRRQRTKPHRQTKSSHNNDDNNNYKLSGAAAVTTVVGSTKGKRGEYEDTTPPSLDNIAYQNTANHNRWWGSGVDNGFGTPPPAFRQRPAFGLAKHIKKNENNKEKDETTDSRGGGSPKTVRFNVVLSPVSDKIRSIQQPQPEYNLYNEEQKESKPLEEDNENEDNENEGEVGLMKSPTPTLWGRSSKNNDNAAIFSQQRQLRIKSTSPESGGTGAGNLQGNKNNTNGGKSSNRFAAPDIFADIEEEEASSSYTPPLPKPIFMKQNDPKLQSNEEDEDEEDVIKVCARNTGNAEQKRHHQQQQRPTAASAIIKRNGMIVALPSSATKPKVIPTITRPAAAAVTASITSDDNDDASSGEDNNDYKSHTLPPSAVTAAAVTVVKRSETRREEERDSLMKGFDSLFAQKMKKPSTTTTLVSNTVHASSIFAARRRQGDVHLHVSNQTTNYWSSSVADDDNDEGLHMKTPAAGLPSFSSASSNSGPRDSSVVAVSNIALSHKSKEILLFPREQSILSDAPSKRNISRTPAVSAEAPAWLVEALARKKKR